jgi:hypothetical protein
MDIKVSIDAAIKSCSEDHVVVEVRIPLANSMLYGEEIIQTATNAVGQLATQTLLKNLDTDGSPIEMGAILKTPQELPLKR